LFGKDFINIDPSIKQKYVFIDGPMMQAIKKGKIIILENIDTLDASVSESLNGIL
jgi:midasin (ATPase involved in ribosome maturation)